jgi:hypothetical protein
VTWERQGALPNFLATITACGGGEIGVLDGNSKHSHDLRTYISLTYFVLQNRILLNYFEPLNCYFFLFENLFFILFIGERALY